MWYWLLFVSGMICSLLWWLPFIDEGRLYPQTNLTRLQCFFMNYVLIFIEIEARSRFKNAKPNFLISCFTYREKKKSSNLNVSFIWMRWIFCWGIFIHIFLQRLQSYVSRACISAAICSSVRTLFLAKTFGPSWMSSRSAMFPTASMQDWWRLCVAVPGSRTSTRREKSIPL